MVSVVSSMKMTSRLYIFFLYLFPSFAVVKDSLTTELSVRKKFVSLMIYSVFRKKYRGRIPATPILLTNQLTN